MRPRPICRRSLLFYSAPVQRATARSDASRPERSCDADRTQREHGKARRLGDIGPDLSNSEVIGRGNHYPVERRCARSREETCAAVPIDILRYLSDEVGSIEERNVN